MASFKNVLIISFICFILVIPFSSASTDSFADGIEIIHNKGDYSFKTMYSPSDFEATWKITGNKAINIQLNITTQKIGSVVMVEHMHCDIIIESTFSGFDEITQDSMDDSFHGIQGGFFVNLTHPYYEVFSIEGSSPDFQRSMETAWIYGDFAGSWFGGTNEFKFSEKTLTEDYGVYGTTLFVVYDIIIKEQNSDYFHKIIISDNIFIDKEGNIVNNEGNSADLTSGEQINGYAFFEIIGIIGTFGLVGFISRRISRRNSRGL